MMKMLSGSKAHQNQSYHQNRLSWKDLRGFYKRRKEGLKWRAAMLQ